MRGRHGEYGFISLAACLLSLPWAGGQEGSTPSIEGGGDSPRPAGTSAPAPREKKPLYLILDYLPEALYEGEPLTACFRVENTTGADADVEILAEGLDGEGRVLRATTEKITAKAGAFASYRQDHDLRGAHGLRFSLKGSGAPLAGPMLRILRDADDWPPSAACKGRLAAAQSGELLIPVASRSEKEERRAFAPVRWALGLPAPHAGTPLVRALLLLPGAWGVPRTSPGGGPRSGGAEGASARSDDGAASAATNLDFGVLAQAQDATPGVLGPYPLEGPAPILCAVGDALRALGRPAPARVVVVLPPEDLAGATDPRVYRIALETLLTRLKRAGVRQTVLCPPLRFGVPAKRRELLVAEARAAAGAHGAQVVDEEAELEERHWRLDPETPGIYGQKPNQEGLRVLRQKLAALLQ